MSLCRLLLPRIDLGRYSGVHPASGALDVVPFVNLDSNPQLPEIVRHWATDFHQEFQIPVRFYEQSATNDHRSLPLLRGQLKQSLLGPGEIPFSLGQSLHPTWGQTIVGIRDFLLAVNINFVWESEAEVRHVANAIRKNRDQGDAEFAGVRALVFRLESVQKIQLSMNLTRPDEISFDRIYQFAKEHGLQPVDSELIGVIRRKDLAKSTQLTVEPRQMVD